MPRRGHRQPSHAQPPGYVDLIEDEDDFGIIVHDDGDVDAFSSHANHEIIVDAYEPPNSWLPDDPTYALDDESGWRYDAEVLREDLSHSQERVAIGSKRKRPARKRSRISVCCCYSVPTGPN
jgi:hypothetical protein